MEEEHQSILVLYHKMSCPFCKKVRDYLKEIKKTIPMKDIDKDPKAKEELLHLGGKSQVPCLFIDGAPLYESGDIIEYLKEKKDILP
ncbi:MAG: glutathione S-transferase N-terminal domain-containing protein [Simkania sp.]|nr:glutathione S-transferase N-terminal domain-containing protein [Simkania sp.]